MKYTNDAGEVIATLGDDPPQSVVRRVIETRREQLGPPPIYYPPGGRPDDDPIRIYPPGRQRVPSGNVRYSSFGQPVTLGDETSTMDDINAGLDTIKDVWGITKDVYNTFDGSPSSNAGNANYTANLPIKGSLEFGEQDQPKSSGFEMKPWMWAVGAVAVLGGIVYAVKN